MTPSGLIIMIVSVGTVVTMFTLCVWKVLTQPMEQEEHLHGVDLHTPDIDAKK